MKLALYKCTLLLLSYLYIQLSRILLYINEMCWSQLFFVVVNLCLIIITAMIFHTSRNPAR